MTEQNECEATRAKLSAPAEHEAEPALNVRLPVFADLEAWKEVRRGLIFVRFAIWTAVGSLVLAVAFFLAPFFLMGHPGRPRGRPLAPVMEWFGVITFFAGLGIGVVLLIVGGVLCRNVPAGQRGERKIRWCLVCFFFVLTLLIPKGAALYFLEPELNLGPLLGTPLLVSTVQDALTIAVAAFAVPAFVLWMLFLIDVSRAVSDFSVEACSLFCLALVFLVACSYFLVDDHADVPKLGFIVIGSILFIIFKITMLYQLSDRLRPKRRKHH